MAGDEMTILKLKKNKIRAMKCVDKGNDYRACNHLWIGTLFGVDLVPYYCDKKKAEIINPSGKKECEYYG